MTIEEKRCAIYNYCRSKPTCTCEQEHPCPLKNLPSSDGSCSSMWLTTEEVERNFALVSAMPDYNGPKEKEDAPTKPTDSVNHPDHYTQSSMECIDEMILIFGVDAVADFCLCNAWKYRARAPYKNGMDDMAKANWYIAKYKELMTGEKGEC